MTSTWTSRDLTRLEFVHPWKHSGAGDQRVLRNNICSVRVYPPYIPPSLISKNATLDGPARHAFCWREAGPYLTKSINTGLRPHKTS